MSGTITFDILDYWHAGAGHGAGRFLDATVKRSPSGLPILPGRTVKGLLRDAMKQCETFGHLAKDTTEHLFGSTLGTDRFQTEPGSLIIGNAELPEGWEQYAATEEGQALVPGFFDDLATTAIDDDGQALEGSLRRVEVAIPLKLKASWESRDDGDSERARDALAKACGLIRRLGSSRTRGLGRVEVYLTEERS